MLERDVRQAAEEALQRLQAGDVQLRFVTATEDAGVFRVGLWTDGIGPNITVEFKTVLTPDEAVDKLEKAIAESLGSDWSERLTR